MAVNFDYDFSGYATKANTKCYDGLTIAPNAFKGDNGKKVPVESQPLRPGVCSGACFAAEP